MGRTTRRMIIGLLLALGGTAQAQVPGLIVAESPHSVADTTDKLVSALEEKGMTIFARIDHAAGAKSADMDLPATELVIFGNPKAGTPLMQCGRTVGIDLPQKMLIWEDQGTVWVGYNEPLFLGRRHGLRDCVENLDKVKTALEGFAEAAVAP